jgi:hypothetical protein
VWIYPPELAAALGDFGLRPLPSTPPPFVRDALSDLYRYEIRRLKSRLLAGAFPKGDYVSRVIALRKKYWPLTMTPDVWERVCASTGDGHNTSGNRGPTAF